jgi:hypothetical protein
MKYLANVKLAQRFVRPLSHRGRVGEGETGIASFIFRDGKIAMPVRIAIGLAAVLFAIPASSMSLFSSCDDGSAEPRPEWVIRPDYSLPGYYVGVGQSDKSGKAERQKESETFAKRDLVEHIEVTIKAENEQSTRVSNQKIQNDAQSKVTVSAEEVLRGLEIKSRWVDKDTCVQYTLMVISNKAIEQAKREKTMKNRLQRFKLLLAEGTSINKNPDINVRRKYLEDAQEMLTETNFILLPEENGKVFYEKQLKDAFASIDKESSQAKGMALFVLNKDHNLKDGVIGKMVDQLRAADQSTDRLMENCDQEQACIKTAKERGFTRLTMLIADCHVGISQMGSLKGKLTVTKKIYDLDSRKIIDESHAMSAEVIGWSNEELDWSAAAEKVMQGLK